MSGRYDDHESQRYRPKNPNMPGRGNGRGRGGRGTFKTSARDPRDSRDIHDRLGKISTYTKNNHPTGKKYKFVRPTQITSCVSVTPPENRIKMLCKRFLKSYYEIFDRPGRANLESQYSSDAFFSFSATHPMPTLGRNLLQVHEPENRVSLLFHDKKNIAGALAQFSPTEHMVQYLTYDVPFYIADPMSVTSMQLVVTGIFKDTSQMTNPLKAFNRVFMLKLVSMDAQGEPVYEIFNDLFMLQPPTPDQIKKYHQDSQIAKRLSTNPSEQRANASTTGDMTNRSQEELIKTIMAKTRMNNTGSRQLLQDCNWDEDKSMNVFNSLFAANKIPQEFFAL